MLSCQWPMHRTAPPLAEEDPRYSSPQVNIWDALRNVWQRITAIDWGKVGKFFSDIGTETKNIDWGKLGQAFNDIGIALAKVDWAQVGTADSSRLPRAFGKVDWD